VVGFGYEAQLEIFDRRCDGRGCLVTNSCRVVCSSSHIILVVCRKTEERRKKDAVLDFVYLVDGMPVISGATQCELDFSHLRQR
jgi:hypothetical protein